MEFGLAKGLSVDGNYDARINDLYRRQEADQRAEQLAASKTALFMKDIEFQNAANIFDAPRVKQYAQGKIQEIGAFYRDNPDLQYNPAKLAQLKLLVNDLKSNPDTLRSVASDAARKQQLADMDEVAKNPSQYDVEAYQAGDQEWKNYEQFGNQKGQQAAAKDGVQTYLYRKPQNLVDINTSLPEIGSKIKNLEKRDGKSGEYYLDIPDAMLNETVKGVYADPAMRRSVELFARKNNWNKEQEYNWVASKIKEGVDNQYHAPDYALERLNMQREGLNLQKAELAAKMKGEAPAITTFEDTYNANKPHGFNNIKATTDILGGGKMIVNGVDVTGAGDWKSDGTWIRAGKDSPYRGMPLANGYIQMPIKEAVSLGLVKESKLFGDPVVMPGFGDRVSIRETERNGKTVEYVHIKHALPVDVKDQATRSVYNNMTMNAKHTQAPIDQFSNNVPAASKQDWLNNGWSEEQIQQAASQGKIKVN